MSLHDLLIAPFSYEFMRRGLLSAMLLGVSGGLLGCVLVLRRLALMGDALSHSLLPGVAAAWLLFGTSTVALFLGGLIAGLLTALGSALLSRLTRVKEDAAFGSLFILFFGAGVALISKLPTRLNLADFLFGNVLGVSAADLRLAAAVSGCTAAVFVVFYRSILLETFDPVFNRATGGRGGLVHLGFLTLTVLNLVAAMQTMGIVLALGLFLLPAVSAYLWCDRFVSMLLLSVALALLGSVVGILLSFHAGLASGAAIVLCLGAIFVVSALFSPRYGAVRALWRGARAEPGHEGDPVRPSLSALAACAAAAGQADPRPLRVATLSTVLAEIAARVGGSGAEVDEPRPARRRPAHVQPVAGRHPRDRRRRRRARLRA